jgi:hypothetical protein
MGYKKRTVRCGLCGYPVGKRAISRHCQGDADETWSNVTALPVTPNQTLHYKHTGCDGDVTAGDGDGDLRGPELLGRSTTSIDE